MPVDPSTDEGKVRLLINDVREAGDGQVFTDQEIEAFLALEGANIKRAAAQAIDTIADDEALTAKYVRDRDLTTDGAKVADSLRKRADALRTQADDDEQKATDTADDGGGFFQIVAATPPCTPELTERDLTAFPWC